MSVSTLPMDENGPYIYDARRPAPSSLRATTLAEAVRHGRFDVVHLRRRAAEADIAAAAALYEATEHLDPASPRARYERSWADRFVVRWSA